MNKFFKEIWPSDLVFDQTWPIFELDLEITKTNILVKFHEDWNKTVASRGWTRKMLTMDNWPRTKSDHNSSLEHFVLRWANKCPIYAQCPTKWSLANRGTQIRCRRMQLVRVCTVCHCKAQPLVYNIFWENNFLTFSPGKCIGEEIWSCPKNVISQPDIFRAITIWTNLVEFTIPMLHTMYQDLVSKFSWFWKRRF